LKTLPAKTMLRGSVVLLAALAWLAVSNHCALASFEASAGVIATPTCHGMADHHAPARQKKESDVECCKVLRATLPSLEKHLLAQPASSFALQPSFAALLSVTGRPRPILPLELDTGPPKSASFAETVLQQSLLAHAPPA
jgi:hypothetical protein